MQVSNAAIPAAAPAQEPVAPDAAPNDTANAPAQGQDAGPQSQSNAPSGVQPPPGGGLLQQLPPAPFLITHAGQEIVRQTTATAANADQLPPGNKTAAAQAAEVVAAQMTEAEPPEAPTASDVEMLSLELLLADPANQEIVEQFGGELEPLSDKHRESRYIMARYGPDLSARLTQLHNAQEMVRSQFLGAINETVSSAPPKGFAASVAAAQGMPGNPIAASVSGQPWGAALGEQERVELAERITQDYGVPGWRFEFDADTRSLPPQGIGWQHNEFGTRPAVGVAPSDAAAGMPGKWVFDADAFVGDYIRGDSPEQRAFAHLYSENQEEWGISLNQVGLGYKFESSERNWPLDPTDPNKLHNPDLIWFDPSNGWRTDKDNMKKRHKLDRAWDKYGSAILGAAASIFTAGALAPAALTAAATGAISGAVGSVVGQMASDGKFDFGNVLRSALTGGATAGLAGRVNLGSAGAAGARLGDRLAAYAQNAVIGGTMAELGGGKFIDGVKGSALGSVASEVTGHIDARIAQMVDAGELNTGESAALRLLSRATGSAIRVVGDKDNPAAAWAQDFLNGLMQDGADHLAQSATPGAQTADGAAVDEDRLGQFITGLNGSAPADAPQTSTTRVQAGDTVESLARQHYGDDWRAAVPLLMSGNDIQPNPWGSPMLGVGDTLSLPPLTGLNSTQLGELSRLGGDIIAGNTRGLDIRTQLQVQHAAEQAARQAAAAASKDPSQVLRNTREASPEPVRMFDVDPYEPRPLLPEPGVPVAFLNPAMVAPPPVTPTPGAAQPGITAVPAPGGYDPVTDMPTYPAPSISNTRPVPPLILPHVPVLDVILATQLGLSNWVVHNSKTPALPTVLVGDQSDPRSGPNRRGNRHTSGVLQPQYGGNGEWRHDAEIIGGKFRPAPTSGGKYPPDSLISDNGVIIRPNNSSGGVSIDIPENGNKPHETLHYPPKKK